MGGFPKGSLRDEDLHEMIKWGAFGEEDEALRPGAATPGAGCVVASTPANRGTPLATPPTTPAARAAGEAGGDVGAVLASRASPNGEAGRPTKARPGDEDSDPAATQVACDIRGGPSCELVLVEAEWEVTAPTSQV